MHDLVPVEHGQRQSEVRIVLYPKEQIDLKQMTVQLSRPEKLFEEVFRDLAAALV
jgi:hypothetical protein